MVNSLNKLELNPIFEPKTKNRDNCQNVKLLYKNDYKGLVLKSETFADLDYFSTVAFATAGTCVMNSYIRYTPHIQQVSHMRQWLNTHGVRI